MTITPAAQPSSRMANASRGVGSGRGSTSALSPAPVITSAVSRAKTSLLWRASKPMTTLPPPVRRCPEVGRQAGRGAGHHDPVHPVRSRAEGAAQPRRTELEGAGEAVGQVGVVATRLDVGDACSSSARVCGSGSSAAQARARVSRSAAGRCRSWADAIACGWTGRCAPSGDRLPRCPHRRTLAPTRSSRWSGRPSHR